MKPDEDLVLVAGAGRLPGLVLDSALAAGRSVVILTLPGTDAETYKGNRCIPVGLDDYLEVLGRLSREGARKLVIAGAVRRPSIAAADASPDIWNGDDAAIRSLLAPVLDLGFDIVGAHEIVPGLLAAPGVLTRARPGKIDHIDVARAAEIVGALGAADVGQATVVARRVCIAVESAAGTDFMLATVGQAMSSLFPESRERSGLLYKAPKPGQEMRVDLPVVGPETVQGIADAGLRGMAVQANGVMLLQRDEMVELADHHGLFIWALTDDLN